VQVSGRSYHFIGRIPLDEPVIDRLAGVVPQTPTWYDTHHVRRPAFVKTAMTVRQARAAVGLGCLIEYIAHLVLAGLKNSPIPVVVNGTVVGSGFAGRES